MPQPYPNRITWATAVACAPLSLAFSPPVANAQFQLNFQPYSGTVISSIANQSCNRGGGGGGMMGGMGGMMGGGNCGSTPFLQELVSVGGAAYYHILVEDSGGFAVEYYMRASTGSVCWYGCANARVSGGMMGGMGGMGMMGGGGVAPLSSSAGTGGLNGNPTDPLGAPSFSGNGTGRPDRVAMRMRVQSAAMTQEFLKASEAAKPKITQTLSGSGVTSQFVLDMTNSTYTDINTPGNLTLTQTIQSPGMPTASFDIGTVNGTTEITGGRYQYTAGSGDGGSFGQYAYFADSFDVYAVDWKAYCDPAQNPDSSCVNYGGGGGGMMGGMGGM